MDEIKNYAKEWDKKSRPSFIGEISYRRSEREAWEEERNEEYLRREYEYGSGYYW